MAENKTPTPPKKSFSADWLVGGILAKLGESFDRLTGRNWKPTSSLATSELIERLKKLLDAKVRDLGENGRFVPHNIKLKMQWDKFSTDAEKALEKLRTELHAAAIDHINDHRYHTYAPIKVEVKPDYFTEGVNLHASFEKFGEQEEEADEVLKVTMPNVNLQHIVINPEPEPEPEPEKFVAAFKTAGKEKSIELTFKPDDRRSVGRTKENDLTIDDPSVSKIHASLVLSAENQLMVADTGSTNGTFVNNQRIAYGKAFMITDGDHVKFGTVEVFFRRVPRPVEFETRETFEPEAFKTQNLPVVINPQAVETSQTAIEESFKQAPATEPKMPPPAEVYKTSEGAEIYKTGDGYANISGGDGNGAENIWNDEPKDGAALPNNENESRSFQDNPNDSQVFQTRQGIKFDFDDDNGNGK